MRRFARTLIELAHLIVGLVAVALVTETAAWAYPLARYEITWLGRIVAVGVLLWSIPLFRAAWRRDRAQDRAADRAEDRTDG